MRVRVSWFLAALAVVAAVGAVGAADYKAEIAAFRAQQAERLRSETGWLAMEGLFFLTEGDRFGTGTLNDFVLPEARRPRWSAYSNIATARRPCGPSRARRSR